MEHWRRVDSKGCLIWDGIEYEIEPSCWADLLGSWVYVLRAYIQDVHRCLEITYREEGKHSRVRITAHGPVVGTPIQKPPQFLVPEPGLRRWARAIAGRIYDHPDYTQYPEPARTLVSEMISLSIPLIQLHYGEERPGQEALLNVMLQHPGFVTYLIGTEVIEEDYFDLLV